MDRIGDTFRWKGENVSTTEVAEALSVFPGEPAAPRSYSSPSTPSHPRPLSTTSLRAGVKEVNIFGAAIPGKDGRACMAAMVMDDSLDLAGLLAHARKELPSYAVPLFIRKLPEIEITGTFKHRKVGSPTAIVVAVCAALTRALSVAAVRAPQVTLRKEGFDPNSVSDPLFWLNPDTDTYEPIDNAAYVRITQGKARL